MHDKVYLENGEELSLDILNLKEDEFKRVEKKELIKDEGFKTESISYSKDVLNRFVRKKVSVVAACIISFIIIMAIIGPYLSGYDYLKQNHALINMPPRIKGLESIGLFDGSLTIKIQKANLEKYKDFLIKIVEEYKFVSKGRTTDMLRIKINYYKYMDAENVYHWFGTDMLGRDIFSRVWMGTRISLILAVFVVIINLSIGLIVGSIAGYYGGWIDYFIQRAMEIINSIPTLPLTILIIMFLGASLSSLMFCFILTGWIGMAYSVRIQFYRYKGMEYVLASRTMGAKDRRIMYKYILPNAIGTLITVCALTVPSVIFQEAGLSYLGLGIQAPEPSIGTLLLDGQKQLIDFPFMIISPGIIIVLLMLSFNLLGNGLRDAFNPALRQ